MHEYPITENIIRISEETAHKNNAKRITKITLVVGEQSGFIGESIQMYFDILSKGSLAEKAEIVFRNVKTKLKCEKCGLLFEIANRIYQCPDCGEDGFPTEIGKEFYIESVEVE